jgi:DNA polymerase III subunit epsilon
MSNELAYIQQEINPSWGKAAFIDVETTGLDRKTDEIIELAIVLFAFDRGNGEIIGIVDEYIGLREPSCSISRDASQVHGLTIKSVKGKNLDNDKFEQIISDAEFIVAHNAKFDMGFVKKLFPVVLFKPWYCSMNGIKWSKKGFSSKGLQNLLKDHKITVEKAHRAGADVKACLLLLSKVDDKGVSYLLELIKGRRVSTIENKKTEEQRSKKEYTKSKNKNTGCGCLVVIISLLIVVIIISLNS